MPILFLQRASRGPPPGEVASFFTASEKGGRGRKTEANDSNSPPPSGLGWSTWCRFVFCSICGMVERRWKKEPTKRILGLFHLRVHFSAPFISFPPSCFPFSPPSDLPEKERLHSAASSFLGKVKRGKKNRKTHSQRNRQTIGARHSPHPFPWSCVRTLKHNLRSPCFPPLWIDGAQTHKLGGGANGGGGGRRSRRKKRRAAKGGDRIEQPTHPTTFSPPSFLPFPPKGAPSAAGVCFPSIPREKKRISFPPSPCPEGAGQPETVPTFFKRAEDSI